MLDMSGCAIHMVEEPEGYLTCGECWHSYQTREELVQEYTDAFGRAPEDEIYVCPLCGHDL